MYEKILQFWVAESIAINPKQCNSVLSQSKFVLSVQIQRRIWGGGGVWRGGRTPPFGNARDILLLVLTITMESEKRNTLG